MKIIVTVSPAMKGRSGTYPLRKDNSLSLCSMRITSTALSFPHSVMRSRTGDTRVPSVTPGPPLHQAHERFRRDVSLPHLSLRMCKQT